MKILVKTTQPAKWPNVENKYRASSNPEIADTLMDLYNHQLKLGNVLRSDIQQLTDSMEFAYPSDAQKFRKIIDQFMRSSQTSLLACLKEILNIRIQNRHFIPMDAKPVPAHNSEWMKELAEQLCILKGIDFNERTANEEEFYYYQTMD